MALKQANRLLLLKTPLGEDVLELTAFSGHEEMSRLFSFQLEMISDNNSISADQIVGKNVTFGVKLADGTPRHFNGFVSRFYRRRRRSPGAAELPGRGRPLALVPHADRRLPHLSEQDGRRHHPADFQGSGLQRLQIPTQGKPSQAGILRPIPRNRLQFRLAADGGRRHLLFLQARRRQAHAGAGRSEGAYTDCKEKEVDYPRDAGTRAVKDHITELGASLRIPHRQMAQTDYNFEDHPARSEPTPANLMMTRQTDQREAGRTSKNSRSTIIPAVTRRKTTATPTPKFAWRRTEAELRRGATRPANAAPSPPAANSRSKTTSPSRKQGKPTSLPPSNTRPPSRAATRPASRRRRLQQHASPAFPIRSPSAPRGSLPSRSSSARRRRWSSGPSGEEIWPDKYGRVKVQFYLGPRRQARRQELLLDPLRKPVAGKELGIDVTSRGSARKWSSAIWRAIPTGR